MFSHRTSVSISEKSTGESDYDLRVFPQGFALTPMLRTVIPLKAKRNSSRLIPQVSMGSKPPSGTLVESH